MGYYVIEQIHSITELNPEYNPPGSYLVILDYHYVHTNGTVFETIFQDPYALGPTDPYGMAPTLRQWMDDHPDFPITPYGG